MELDRIRPEPVSPPVVALAVTAVVIAIVGAAWYYWPASESPAPVAAVAPPEAPARPAAPAHYPVPEPSDPAAAQKPLPALDASDTAIAQSLANLFGLGEFAKFFRPESLVRRIVATVDNLPRASYAQRLSPVHPVGGLLVTAGKEESLVLAPGNAARYAPWVKFVGQLDTRRVVAIYVQFYPLFQQAYVELGYPDGYFNNRLVQVIDHLLDAPPAKEPVRLVVRRVLPEFADPALESESAGRKVLIRIGPDNAAVVKAKLRELRRELTERTPGQ
jgi:hypothetical protein